MSNDELMALIHVATAMDRVVTDFAKLALSVDDTLVDGTNLGTGVAWAIANVACQRLHTLLHDGGCLARWQPIVVSGSGDELHP